jgi:2,4-dienoyl-CoA reductase-like NADH-dependent reductase (Old Yellow Enzyme family)
MSKSFEPGEINGMKLKNRFVRSATWSGMASDEGACTPRLIELMAQLAEGGVGLIIPGHAYVSEEGKAGPWQLGAYSDELVSGLRDMTRMVHERGGRIVLQIAHSGFYAKEALTGRMPLAASVIEGLSKSPKREMTGQDIRQVVTSFAQASARCRESGFDGVQIHAAHGYLLSQFLSPIFNKRTDTYGGSIQNRARMLLEVLQAVREAVGPDFPVLVKMNSQDFAENGLSLEDAVDVGVMLEERGIDAIELSGGLLTDPKLGPSRSGIKTEEKEAYFQHGARVFRERIDVPLILVGGIRSYEVAERLLAEGTSDYVSMCRPFIREPGLINRWKSGDLRKSECLSDNQCFKPAWEGKGIDCVTKKKDSGS